MTLITEEYRALNRHALETSKHYATTGHRRAEMVWELIKLSGARDILDYGAGRNLLNEALAKRAEQDQYEASFWAYDPCVPDYAAEPFPADFVACTDVLEHVEPECLDDVLAHLRHLTKKVAYLSIALKPAKNTVLADGRNPHLSLHPPEVWLTKLFAVGFKLKAASVDGATLITVVQ